MDFWRQEDLIDSRLHGMKTAVIGAGGIGSFLVLSLAKMGIADLIVCDPDEVEPHNVPNQLYGEADVGLAKVQALAGIVGRQTGTFIEPIEGEVTEPSTQLPGHDLLIAAVDSMEARKKLFEGRNSEGWYMDGRMGAQMAWVLTVPPGDKGEYYQSKLYSDKEASEEPCTARSTVYGGYAISCVLANIARRVAMDDSPPKEVILDLVTWTMMAE